MVNVWKKREGEVLGPLKVAPIAETYIDCDMVFFELHVFPSIDISW
jgi:hypothetical protein